MLKSRLIVISNYYYFENNFTRYPYPRLISEESALPSKRFLLHCGKRPISPFPPLFSCLVSTFHFLFPRANRNELNRVSVFIPANRGKSFVSTIFEIHPARQDTNLDAKPFACAENHEREPTIFIYIYIFVLISSNFGDSYFL